MNTSFLDGRNRVNSVTPEAARERPTSTLSPQGDLHLQSRQSSDFSTQAFRSRPYPDHTHERNFSDSHIFPSELVSTTTEISSKARTRKRESFSMYDLFQQRRDARQFYDNKKTQETERLNFDLHENMIYHLHKWKNRHKSSLCCNVPMQKWFLVAAIGLITGMIAFFLYYFSSKLCTYALDHIRAFLLESISKGLLCALLINVSFAGVAAGMTIWIAPAAAGSGVPEVKAYLNGSWSRHAFSVKALFIKIIGVVFVIGALFVVGKEGPMVHAGAIIAQGLSRGRSSSLGYDFGIFKQFRHDREARMFVSCGAAAGVAAAFGAPIGGVLFALEEVSSFWSPSLTWLTFFCAALSTGILSIFLSCASDGETCFILNQRGLMKVPKSYTPEYRAEELIFFMFIGVLGGIFGALFSKVNTVINQVRNRLLVSKTSRFFNVLFIAALTTILLVLVPLIDSCREIPGDIHDFIDVDLGKIGRYNCNENFFNPTAAMLLSNNEESMKVILSPTSNESDVGTELIVPFFSSFLVFIVYGVLAVITYGIDIPSGLFVPCILIGSAIGRLTGIFIDRYVADVRGIDIGTYAFMGAAAFLSGATRMTISLSAILIEITNEIQYTLPLILVISTAKLVADRISFPIYDMHIVMKNLPYLEPEYPKWVPSIMCAQDIMKENLVVLSRISSVETIIYTLQHNTHNGFPVVDAGKHDQFTYNQTDGEFIGLILRWQLIALLGQRHFYPYDVCVDEKFNYFDELDFKNNSMRNVFDVQAYLKKCGIARSEWAKCFVNLTPYTHTSCHSVTPNTPIFRVYELFRGFGLRHLCVIKDKMVCGLITFDELTENHLEEVAAFLDERYDHENAIRRRIRFLGHKAQKVLSSERANPVGSAFSSFEDMENEERHKLPLV